MMRGMSRLRAMLRLPARPLEVRIPQDLLEVQRDGPAPLDTEPAGETLDVAFVVPSFRQVSGGHTTIARTIRALEARGVRCSIRLVDDDARTGAAEAGLADRFTAAFGPIRGPVRVGFEDWSGADVVVATAWQTVPAALRARCARSRAYFVQDHEPEFYATSAEREWASWTYRQGLHPIVASPWLAEVLRRDYGSPSSVFDIGVDTAIYRPGTDDRDGDRVLFYARASTARRGVPLGLVALEELHRRRPSTRIAIFGDARPLRTPFPHEHLGVLGREELADHYRRAAVGLVVSLTNPSLIPHEMLACGLACVDVASASSVVAHGDDTPISLARLDPSSMADAIGRLLDDPAERTARARAGTELAASLTWERTGEQVERGLREALERVRSAA
jgi:glycosyltransferase involved in cell wall biosynthesis